MYILSYKVITLYNNIIGKLYYRFKFIEKRI